MTVPYYKKPRFGVPKRPAFRRANRSAYGDPGIPLPLDGWRSGAKAGYSAYDLGNKRGSVVETGETVYGDFVDYESDFSAGTDGWAPFEGVGTGNIDAIGGRDDNYRFVCTATDTWHTATKGLVFTIGNTYDVSLDVYLPSGNSNMDSVHLCNTLSSSKDSTTTTDTWVTLSATFVADNATLRIQGKDGASWTFPDAGADDLFYIRNVTVTELDTYRTLDVAYHNPAVRVRRDSDNIHKSFAGGEFTQIENWVNEDVVTLTDLFTNDITGWSTSGTGTFTHNATNGTLQLAYTSGQTGGVIETAFNGGDSGNGLRYNIVVVAKRTVGATSKIRLRTSSTFARTTHSISANVTNSGDASANGYILNLTSDYQTFEVEFSKGDNASDSVYFQIDGGSASETTTIEVDSIVVTQLTSNGHVATWYDQSGVEVQSVEHDSSVDGWGSYTALGTTNTANYDSGDTGHESCLRIESTDGSFDRAQLSLAYSIGDVVRVTMDYKSVSGAGDHLISSDGAPTLFTGAELTSTSWDTVSTIISVTSAITTIRFYSSNAGASTDELLIDNVRIETLTKAHNDATQATAASQPKIVDAGSLVTDANGNYRPLMDGVDDYWTFTLPVTGQPLTVFSVTDTDSAATQQGIWGDGTSVFSFYRSTGFHAMYASVTNEGDAYSADQVYLRADVFNGASSSLTVDGNETSTPTIGGQGISSGTVDLGRYSGNELSGGISAFILYDTDKSTDRSAIKQAISKIVKTALS